MPNGGRGDGDDAAAFDDRCLAQTLELAARGGRTVHPDPLVGSIVVGPDPGGEGATSRILGRGYHAVRGGAHAEPGALAEASERVIGATLYCSLEPCGYEAPGKRQPSCAHAIVNAGISRVVIGQVDPHPRVRGGGVRVLREAGIRVDIAADPLPFWLADPVYVTTMWLGRPFIHAVSSEASRWDGAGPVVYEYAVSAEAAVAVPEALAAVPDDARSILLYSPDPAGLCLAGGQHVDMVDGRPQPGWAAALAAASSQR